MINHAPGGFTAVLLMLSCAGSAFAQSGRITDVRRAFLVGTSDGQVVRDESKTLVTPTPTTQRPGTPVAKLITTTSRPVNPGSSIGTSSTTMAPARSSTRETSRATSRATTPAPSSTSICTMATGKRRSA